MIKIGDRVVCVDDTDQENPLLQEGTMEFLQEDCYYRVRGFDFDGNVLLEDMLGGLYNTGSEAGYRPSRFRVITQELDYEFVDDVIKSLLERPLDLN